MPLLQRRPRGLSPQQLPRRRSNPQRNRKGAKVGASTAKLSKKSSDPQPADDVIKQLEQVDAIDAAENPGGPLPPGASDQAPADLGSSGAATLSIVPNPFLLQTCAQVAAGIVSASKRAGWPGLPDLYIAVVPEAEWISQVAQSGAAVVAKRWPSLNSDSTPEFALCCLALPWLAWSVPRAFVLLFQVIRRKPAAIAATEPATDERFPTAGNRDPRRDGERQNIPHAETVTPFPPSFSDRPDNRPQI
jgi:hypothetical protein